MIEAMPASEFQRQKIFWEAHQWGMQDDITAMVASQMHAHRMRAKPIEVRTMKEWAVDACRYKPFIVETADTIRSQIFSMLPIIGDTKNG